MMTPIPFHTLYLKVKITPPFKLQVILYMGVKRDGIVKACGFGSELYAEEEIITECAAFLLARELKVSTTDDQHASYLKSWCSKLRKEPKFINTILGQSVKAKNFILNPIVDKSDNT